MGNIVRVAQESNVEEEIEIGRHAELEAEREDAHVHCGKPRVDLNMKWFSPERANALIPRIAPLVEELLAHRRDLAIRLLETDPSLHGAARTGPHVARPRSPFGAPRFGDLKTEIIRIIQRIEAMGCVMKDIDLGLVDFPSYRDGTPIYLCWKAGESEVTFWHGVDEGFSERKPLDFL
jgi:hypothetical protein